MSLRKWHVTLGQTCQLWNCRCKWVSNPQCWPSSAYLSQRQYRKYINKSLSCSEFYILRIYFSTYWLPPKTTTVKFRNSIVICEFMKYLFISILIVFHGFDISWSMTNSLNLFQKRTWDPCNIYDGALVKIVVDSWNQLTIVTTNSALNAAG